MTARVFVTNENPIIEIRDASFPGLCKDFDSMDKATEFANIMLNYGYNISLNAWDEEKNKS